MKRTILYLIETLGHGGAEHQLVETVKLLDRSRYEPVVCHFRAPSYLAPKLESAGIEVVCLNLPPGKKSWPVLAQRLHALARRTRPALIHTSLFEADVVGGLAGKAAGIPVISTLCNIAGDPVRLADNPRNNRLKFALTNLLWGNALRGLHRHSIAISNAVRESAVATFGMNLAKLSVIYRGIEPGRTPTQGTRAAILERVGLAKASPFLLAIGRLAPQKGHKYLLNALPALLRQFPETQLAIVGEGWLRPTLERQAASLGVAEHVSFLGKRTDVPELLSACDAFVFPSLFEGLGVSLLEASYAGCACVSTNTGPIPEIIETEVNGLLVPPNDSAALSAALLRLAADPALAKRLGAAARERALTRFMLGDKVAELDKLYSRLLD